MADGARMALAELLPKAEAEPGADVLREGVRALAQALMELAVEQHLRAGGATATGRGPGTRGWGRSASASRASGTGASSRACSSRARAASGRWWRWCRRRTWAASRRGGSTPWSRHSGWRGSA